MVLPGFRNHHHDGLGKAPAAHEQKLEHVVETPRVGKVGFDNREGLLEIVAEEGAFEHTLAGNGLVHVAAQGVDFTVVRHESQGLCAVPGGKGIS